MSARSSARCCAGRATISDAAPPASSSAVTMVAPSRNHISLQCLLTAVRMLASVSCALHACSAHACVQGLACTKVQGSRLGCPLLAVKFEQGRWRHTYTGRQLPPVMCRWLIPETCPLHGRFARGRERGQQPRLANMKPHSARAPATHPPTPPSTTPFTCG